MELLQRERHDISDHGSSGVQMIRLLREEGARTDVAYYGADSVLGRHPASAWQSFMVVVGSGWVSGEDEVHRPCTAGDCLLWARGESHESGSDHGMVVVITEVVDRSAAM